MNSFCFFYAKYKFVCVLFPWFGLFWPYLCVILVALRCCDIVPLYPSLNITLDIGLNRWCASEMVWWWCEPTDDEISSQPFSFCSVGNNSGRLDSRNLLSNWWRAPSDSNHFFAFLQFFCFYFFVCFWSHLWCLGAIFISYDFVSSLLCVTHNDRT